VAHGGRQHWVSWFHLTTLSLPYALENIVPTATRTARTVSGRMLPAAERMSERLHFKAAPSRYRCMHTMSACSRNGDTHKNTSTPLEQDTIDVATHMQGTVRISKYTHQF